MGQRVLKAGTTAAVLSSLHTCCSGCGPEQLAAGHVLNYTQQATESSCIAPGVMHLLLQDGQAALIHHGSEFVLTSLQKSIQFP